MEVILREDIDNLGTRGAVVRVASGYARNFLLPKRMAVAATESNKKIVEQERLSHLKKEAKEQADASELGKLMAAVEVTIAHKAGEDVSAGAAVRPSGAWLGDERSRLRVGCHVSLEVEHAVRRVDGPGSMRHGCNCVARR